MLLTRYSSQYGAGGISIRPRRLSRVSVKLTIRIPISKPALQGCIQANLVPYTNFSPGYKCKWAAVIHSAC